MKLVLTYVIGLVFGLGISMSGMANPAKVLNFFDFFGVWDPSLMFVMGGAVTVSFFGYRWLFKRYETPAFEPKFIVPSSRVIDAKLVGGSLVFGVGWGIAGFCPGGALPALGTTDLNVWVFFVALVAGIFAAKFAMKQTAARAARQM
jgi:Predicted transporter component